MVSDPWSQAIWLCFLPCSYCISLPTLINSIYSKLHIDNVTQEKIKYKCYIYNDVLKVPNEIEWDNCVIGKTDKSVWKLPVCVCVFFLRISFKTHLLWPKRRVKRIDWLPSIYMSARGERCWNYINMLKNGPCCTQTLHCGTTKKILFGMRTHF